MRVTIRFTTPLCVPLPCPTCTVCLNRNQYCNSLCLKLLLLFCGQLNTGQYGNEYRGRDLKIEKVWMQGLSGCNVTIGVVDDGRWQFSETHVISPFLCRV